MEDLGTSLETGSFPMPERRALFALSLPWVEQKLDKLRFWRDLLAVGFSQALLLTVWPGAFLRCVPHDAPV